VLGWICFVAACTPVPSTSVKASIPYEIAIFSGPDITSAIIGHLSPDMDVLITGKHGEEWVCFEFGGGVAWLQRFAVDLEGDFRQLPDLTAAPLPTLTFTIVPSATTLPSATSLPSATLLPSATFLAPSESTQVTPSLPAVDRIDWTEAGSYVGEEKTVCGPVMGAKYAEDSNGKPTFLNVGEDYPSPKRFTVLIWGEDRSNFAFKPEDEYLGKTICVSGEIQEYKGSFEIIVSSSDEIEVQQSSS
jgi:hypothetical protein